MKTLLLASLSLLFISTSISKLDLGSNSLSLVLTQNQVTSSSETVVPKSHRAVVVGISEYQDSLLTKLPESRQNAELYAAFLRSREGGLLAFDQIQLLTNEKATLAGFIAAIEWLDEESQLGDQITIYFTGNARLVNTDEGLVPHLFLADSPLLLGRAGSLPLAKFCYLAQDIARKKSLHFQLILDLYMGKTTVKEDEVWREWLAAIQQSFPFAFFEEALDKNQDSKQKMVGISPMLLDGMLGEADFNDDLKILPKEMAKYLSTKCKKLPGGYVAFLAFSEEKIKMSEVEETRGLRNTGKTQSKLPSLLGQDLTQLEDSMLASADEKTRQWYLDFMLTKKLGKLMTPAGRCTSDLYDSLLTVSSIQALHSHLRRQLAASLQDETQQALNDYLRTDTRELQRRWKHGGNYKAYPKYMNRVVELIGEKHFMNSIIQCKKFYFEGLTARLDFEKNGDSLLLLEAMEKQLFALKYEPEAAFVLNELGILHFLQHSDTSKVLFLHAIKLAPQWGVPFLNISLFHFEKGELDSALFYAHTAVNLTPWNPVAVANIGRIYHHKTDYENADVWLRRAASLEPTNPSIYYNLACVKTMQGTPQAGLEWLELAFKNGFTDLVFLENDKDLNTLRNTKEFEMLRKKYFPDLTEGK
ncbi:MAG: hypothetical protein GC192_20120 [Bacteroidetes bacterium]|nr:hypothetical protein [Bacteroidota bacterium]